MLYLRFVSSILLVYISIFQLCHAILPALPSSIRVDSKVTSITPTSLEVYVVEEYVDILDGSIRVTVQDISEDLEERDLNSYYRIKDYSNEKADTSSIDEGLVAFSHEDLICRNVGIDNWQLKGLTEALEVLYKSSEFTTLEIEDDRTSLATLALLKIIYANAQLFVLDRKDYMRFQSTISYFFQARIDLEDEDRAAKMIVVIPAANVFNSGRLEIGTSLLSQVDSSTHPMLVALIEYDKNDHDTHRSNPLELLDSDGNNLLIVSYLSVQERSTSSNIGMKLGNLNEHNPFSKPSGAGCYSSTRDSLLYVGAKQFSGVYKSLDYSNKRYIAYDSISGHLRIDNVDESKMIYSFKQRKLTYIINGLHGKSHSSKEKETRRARCAQTSLAGDDEYDMFQKVKSMENVIGLDGSLGVVYLGTAQLEDGTHCLVYEREIGPSQIPFIIKLNLRLRILKNSRLFLVYYFVDEFSVQNSNDYRSVWLKRVELSSLTSFSKYKLLNSQVTFSQFAWDLESLVDDSSLFDEELLHPVRTFDIIECQPMQAHSKLEILLKLDIGETPKDDRISKSLVLDHQFDSLEEALIERISRAIDFPRFELNEFELVRMSSEVTDQMHYVLARAKLMDPLDVIHDSKLIGWCKNIDDMPFNKYGFFVDTDRSMIRQECMLKLATEQQKKVISMISCPTFGWCAQLDDLESFDYVRKQAGAERPDADFYVCEIYSVSKEVNSLQLMSDRLKKNSLARILKEEEFVATVNTLPADQTATTSLFKAKVVKVSVTDADEVEAMGNLLRQDQCYTTSSKVNAPDADFKLDIKEIVFDRHHTLYLCHKACQIYPNCRTYSYAASSRTCTLTNVPENYVQKSQRPRLVDEDLLSDLKDDTDCSLYSLNAMYLFQGKSVVLISRPLALESSKITDYYITLESLGGCANLCYSSGLNCQIFLHNPLNKICAIEDKDFQVYKRKTLIKGEIFNKEKKKENYIRLLGTENWSLAHSFHQYSRDYDQYFVVENSQKIDLSESSYTVGQADKQVKITRPACDSLEEIATLYDLEAASCLRECTSIKPDCVMADYCFQSIKSTPTRYCTMYRISGKLETSASDIKDLKDLGKSSLVSAHGCTHYRLNGDFFLLKRLLSGSLGEMGQEIAKEDNEISNRYIESSKNINNNQVEQTTFNGLEIVGHLLLLALGSFLGITMSSQLSIDDYGPKLFSKLTSAYHWLRLKRHLEKSSSRQELNELEDL